MNISEGELQKRVEDALRSCLESIPFLEIRSIEAETQEDEVQPDLFAELELSGRKQTLVILLALKEVPSGANVSLLTPYDEGVFYGAREIDGIRIASPIQIYLDLLGSRGRGEEAAAALLEEVIRPQW